MTAYARNDLETIMIPMEAGGCGETHKRPKLKKGEDPKVWGVDCNACEPILLAVHGFARSEHDIELTPDEVKVQERLEKEGSAATAAMAKEIGAQLAQAARTGLAVK